MENFEKVVRLGLSETVNGRAYSTYCKIKYENKKLSITGVEGPIKGGNCLGGCGQINMSLDLGSIDQFAPGWGSYKLREFLEIWDRWHLNDLRAGSPAQEKYLRDNPSDKRREYEETLKMLTAAGLNPDNGYVYGSAWNTEKVSEKALRFLYNLPDTDITPAWV